MAPNPFLALSSLIQGKGGGSPAGNPASPLNPPTPVQTFFGIPWSSGTYLPDVIGNPGNQIGNLEAGGRVSQEAALRGANEPSPSGLAAGHIKDMQQFLRNRGYNVAIDGVRGPQTNAAVAAFHNHVSPRVFNSRYRPQHPTSGRYVPSNARNPAPAQPVGTTGGAKGASGSSKWNDTPPANPAGTSGAFDPQAFAQSAANAQYDPTIAALNAQIGAFQNQQPDNINAINGWYQQMIDLTNKQLAGLQSQGSTDQGTMGQDIQNAAQLFGGAQAPQVQASGQNDTGFLNALNQSQQDYLTNMVPMYQMQAGQSVADANNAYNQELAQLNSSLQGQKSAKGQAYVSDYQNALNTQQTMQQNAQALNDAQALLPYQVASAKAQAAADQTNAASAGALNTAKLNELNSQISKNMAEAQAAAQKGASFAPGSKDRQTLINNLYKSMVNSSGTAVIGNPVLAQRALYTQAVAYGLIGANGAEKVPGASSVLKAVLQNALASNPQWRNAGWQWNGTTFVQTKK